MHWKPRRGVSASMLSLVAGDRGTSPASWASRASTKLFDRAACSAHRLPLRQPTMLRVNCPPHQLEFQRRVSPSAACSAWEYSFFRAGFTG